MPSNDNSNSLIKISSMKIQYTSNFILGIEVMYLDLAN